MGNVGSEPRVPRRAFSSLTAVTFRFPGSLAPGARRVAVVGPFNGWDPTVHPLVRTASGDWTISIYLPAGRVIYHFDVDGASWLDPNDDGRIRNAWGSEYSVRYVTSRVILMAQPSA
jgi:1,4-alpha-glucan branching enzyme